MSYSPHRGFPAGNPIANALVVIVGVLVIAASLVLGFFAFVVLAALALVFAAVIGIRVWWFNRKLAKAARADRRSSESTEATHVIEGEFHVVEMRTKDRRRDP